MKLNIAENIRNCRRSMKLTQEQLAEALGVTVGAVSKWESGANTPDVALIAELADFFEMSVDALLGYDLQSGRIDAMLKRMTDLSLDRRFAEAVAEAEKALAKYPNDFRIVRQSASIYCLVGVENSDESARRRQLELYEKALTLIDQNTDPDFNEWSIKNRIAEAHICLGDSDKGLELMKANNAQGANDANIAHILAWNAGRHEECLDFMFSDLVNSVSHITGDAINGALAYIPLGRPRDAERIILWALSMYEALAQPGAICHVQRAAARMRLFAAFAALADGRRSDAGAHLVRAREQFAEYMKAPDNSLRGTWVKDGEKYRSFDDLGDDVLTGARKMLEILQGRLEKAKDALPDFDINGATLPELWDEVDA